MLNSAKSSLTGLLFATLYLSSTHMHGHSVSWIGTDTPIRIGGVKLFLWTKYAPLSKMMRSCTVFPPVTKMTTLTDRANSVTIKNTLALGIIHLVFLLNFRTWYKLITIFLFAKHHLNMYIAPDSDYPFGVFKLFLSYNYVKAKKTTNHVKCKATQQRRCWFIVIITSFLEYTIVTLPWVTYFWERSTSIS
jgi:hypothetical protein